MQTSEVLVELVFVVKMTLATRAGASLHVELRIPALHKQSPSVEKARWDLVVSTADTWLVQHPQ